jgi:hypothetical protein
MKPLGGLMLATRSQLSIVGSACWLLFCLPMAKAQSANVTNDVLLRTFMVKSDKESGTIFSIDIDEREYWVTAKHIVTGAKHPPFGTVDSKTVKLNILPQSESNKDWIPITFTVIDPGKDVDIVVLAPEKSLLGKNTIQSVKVASTGTIYGGECEFVGFPFGSSWTGKYEKGEMIRLPFVKHCTISAQIISPQRVWVLDGINNEGFSGGPVVFQTGPSQQIIGVISGFWREPIEVVPLEEPQGQAHPKEAALANAGFIFAFDMTPAIEAIKKNPVGPKRAGD